MEMLTSYRIISALVVSEPAFYPAMHTRTRSSIMHLNINLLPPFSLCFMSVLFFQIQPSVKQRSIYNH